MTGFDKLLEALRDYAERTAKPLADRIVALEKRMGEVEPKVHELAAAPFAYRGLHVPGESYLKNTVLTHDGSLWLARTHTSKRPGDESTDWQLLVRAGRDGRDGRAR